DLVPDPGESGALQLVGGDKFGIGAPADVDRHRLEQGAAGREVVRDQHVTDLTSRENVRNGVDRVRVRVEHRRAGDAHRVDVAARQRTSRYGRARVLVPNDLARSGAERVDAGVLGGDG